MLDGSHPEEQGLKLKSALHKDIVDLLDGSHPEEQGLKPAPGDRLPRLDLA